MAGSVYVLGAIAAIALVCSLFFDYQAAQGKSCIDSFCLYEQSLNDH